MYVVYGTWFCQGYSVFGELLGYTNSNYLCENLYSDDTFFQLKVEKIFFVRKWEIKMLRKKIPVNFFSGFFKDS